MGKGETGWSPVVSVVHPDVHSADLYEAGLEMLSGPEGTFPAGPIWNALHVLIPGTRPPEGAWWFLPHRAWELAPIREALRRHRPPVVVLERPSGSVDVDVPEARVFTTSLDFPSLLLSLAPFTAPRAFVHGTLVEVFGIGVLLAGPSGVGKTECALDLLHRGHFFVADDLVELVFLPTRTLGRSGSRDPSLITRAEIRGLGVVDIQTLFGWARIKREAGVDLVVELLHVPGLELSSDRDPFARGSMHLGPRAFPCVRLPVQASKSLGPIVETAILQFRLEHNR